MNQGNPPLASGGIHHITAVASSAAENLDFYTRVLGMRLVKQTVNFDDPFTYHLYYGDNAGRPGTILTFFPWERISRGRAGSGMVSAIAFAVARGALDHWRGRLDEHRIARQETRRFGETVIRFSDPHGLPLELVAGPDRTAPPDASPDDSHNILGFHSATVLLGRLEPTREVVRDFMGMVLEGREGDRYRFRMGERESCGRLLDLVVDPAAPRGTPGSGTVHHIAFRSRDSVEQQAWQRHLRENGLAVTDVRDRKYFRSIYFHEPGGVLFEIATDPPGFTVDEAPEHLGSALKLPGQYESMRPAIERRLPPLGVLEFPHRFVPPAAGQADLRTIVPLHGTGGDENDLVPLARRIAPSASVISPRGKVLEHGGPRFFARLAEGVFDAAEVSRRAHELADFLEVAAGRYRRPERGLFALGYSNGANIAAAVMLLRPQIFAGAVLMRPMLPLEPEELPDLAGVPVLILRGRFDTVIPASSTDRLTALLERTGAVLKVAEMQAGHEITARDVEVAGNWMAETQSIVSGADRAAANQ